MPKHRSGFQPRRPEGFLEGLLLGCCFFKLGYKTLVDGGHTRWIRSISHLRVFVYVGCAVMQYFKHSLGSLCIEDHLVSGQGNKGKIVK